MILYVLFTLLLFFIIIDLFEVNPCYNFQVESQKENEI